jgi:hypothetical protein
MINAPVRIEDFGDLLTTQDLSKLFGMSIKTAYKEIGAGSFGKPLKFGREYRIPKIYIVQRYFGGYADTKNNQEIQ